MREILFRGKLLRTGKWIEGYYCKTSDTTYAFSEDYDRYPVPEHYCILVDEMTDWGLPNRPTLHAVDPVTIGQYTGLTDKNGKKIFEGDIIRFDGEEFVVFWNGEAFQWQAKSTQTKENAIIYDTGNLFSQFNEFANAFDFGWIAAEPILSGEMTTEVVGNIHDNRLEDFDNHELLEGE